MSIRRTIGHAASRVASIGLAAMVLGTTVASAATRDDSTSYRDPNAFPYEFAYPKVTEKAGDLTVYFTSLSCAGGNLEVNYRIQNASSNPVYGPFKTIVTVNGQQFPDPIQNPYEFLGTLYGGTNVHLSTYEPGPGAHFITVKVDYEHVVVELSEDNNRAEGLIICGPTL